MVVDDCFQVLPFRFLERGDREWLRPHLTLAELPPDQHVFRQGDADADRRAFLLLRGKVELKVDGRSKGLIVEGHYFGERAAIFETPRGHDVVTCTRCTIASLPGHVLLEL